MNIFSYILAIIIFVTDNLSCNDLSSSSSQYCVVSEKRCENKFDSTTQKYKMICDELKCNGTSLSYQCSIDHCALNKSYCDEKETQENSNEINDLKKMFKMSIRVIKKCSNISTKWHVNDVCINGKECFIKKVVPMRSRTNKKITKKIVCTCTGKHSYQCTNDFCTLNSHTCIHFSLKTYSLNEAYNMNIKDCGNNKITLLDT